MKNENGITLIKICIVMAIAIVIAVIIMSIFQNVYKKTRLKQYIAEMQLIQEKVNIIRSEYKLWEKYNPNEAGNFYTYLQNLGFLNANSSSNIYINEFNKIIEKLNTSNLNCWNTNADSIITNYCYFSPQDLEKNLNLKDINLTVIINFYTGNVISKDGIEDGEKIIYRQYDSENGNKLVLTKIYNSEIIPKIKIIENHGLSQMVKISLENSEADISEIYYYDSNNETRKVCSNLKNYSYIQEENAVYFNIDISGTYTFIVEDINFVQYPKIEYEFNLCNAPIMLDSMMGIYWDENGIEKQIISENDYNWYNYSKENLRMANAKTDDGNYWVWIPRYIYKETFEGIDIEFVSKKTNIATNNKSMNGYKIQEAFSKDGEVEGFWISKFQANIENNLINIKPGKTLTVLTAEQAKKQYKNLLYDQLKNYSDIMSDFERKAVLIFSESNEVKISNDLVHYAGGSPDEKDYKNNTKYSSSNNIFGVYDLLTSENEITIESKNNEIGRFRGVIKIKQ